MPGGDRTGPLGGGTRTGRGLGYCSGYEQAGYTVPQPAQGLGLGFRWGGRGCGRGYGRVYNRGYHFRANFRPEQSNVTIPTPSASQEQEIDSLKAQAQELQNVLQQIQERLDQLEA